MPTSNKTAFSKYQAAGNDFILIEDFEQLFDVKRVKELCHRQLGIGADGLILARRAEGADFEMVYFNADGSEAFCGNGLRCFVHFLRDLGFVKESYRISAYKNFLTVKCNARKIFTFFPSPQLLHWEIDLGTGPLFVVDSGVPHAVRFVKEEPDVQREGHALRYHPFFQPTGVNVNFARVVEEGTIELRTYERGVEAETLACGTGAIATAFIAHKLGYVGKEVKIVTRSKEEMQVRIDKEIELSGPSIKVFDGWYFQ